MIKFLPFLFLALFVSCVDDTSYIPKPHAFPKITFPEKEYVKFEKESCPFMFEMPAYAKMVRNKDFMGEEVPNDCWYDLVIPAFDAKFHMTYYPIENRTHFDKLVSDTYRLSNEHTKKANYINTRAISKEGVFIGKVFDISGPAATPLTFFLTDEENHFFRASLYINTQVRPDSLAPIFDFLRQDANRIINTFSWK